MQDIFFTYLQTCGHSTPGSTVGCKDDYVSWSGSAVDGDTHYGLVAGVNQAFGETSIKATAFVRDGDGYGVSGRL
jgi:hypothetical protein